MKVLQQRNGTVVVIYQAVHNQHENSIAHFLLSKSEREALAGKLEIGVNMDRILYDIRTSVNTVGPQLLHVRRKDLHNIAAEVHIKHLERLAYNDAASIQQMVEKMDGQANSPVICHK